MIKFEPYNINMNDNSSKHKKDKIFKNGEIYELNLTMNTKSDDKLTIHVKTVDIGECISPIL